MARSIVDFDVPGGPSSMMSRPAVTAASTRSSSRRRPTTERAISSRRAAAPGRFLAARAGAPPGRGARPSAEAVIALLAQEPGVDRQHRAGDVAGLVGGEEDDGVGDVHRL